MPIKSRMRRAAEIVLESIRAGNLRETVLMKALLTQYRSQAHKHWKRYPGHDHYFLHTPQLFRFFAGERGEMLYGYTRAFLSAEVIAPGALVLDIGCGDGTLTKRFYAPRAGHVDAVDIEESAIEYAKKYNAASNIHYQLLNAVTEPFPKKAYDVIVFDGAIGHFSRDGAIEVLKKISAALRPGGVFCGSESVGREGDDHLQYFMQLEDLRSILLPAFPFVRLKSQKYSLTNDFVRHEAYWRAANSDVLGEWEWR